jgi:hypothetical protein
MGSKSRSNTSNTRLARPSMRWRLPLAAIVAAGGLGAGAMGAQVPSRSLPTYVLLAKDKLQMKDFAFTNVGNVGVNAAGGTIQWGRASFFPDDAQVVADVVNRAAEHSSLWCLFANDVHSPLGNITIRGCGGQPIPWAPQPLIDPLPPDPSCTPGSQGVSVAKGASMSLAPGSYGRVRVLNGATLELTGGTYCFGDVKLGRKAKISVDAPVDVTSMGKFISGPYSRLIPASGSGVGASDIGVGVAGRLVKLSHRAKVWGVFYVPNGQLRFGRGGNFTGQFVAQTLRSDFADTFTLEVCGNGIVDPGEQCDGGSQPDPCCTDDCRFEPQGTPCPDGDLCNGNETCSAFGQCVPGTHLVCDDNNVCTTDSCLPASGCHQENKPNGFSCSDGLYCNGQEICVGGTCTDQADPTCSDGNPCTQDLCDNAAGSCLNPPVPAPIPGCECPNGDSDCDNHNVCDGKETCDPSHQFCNPGVPLVCSTANQCLDPSCDPTTGCGTTPKPDGAPCNDDDACSVDDQCTGGACGGMANGCDDGNPCTADSCDSQTGACHNDPIPGCGQGPGPGTFCSLTQGAYGAPGGIANGGQGWVTNNPGVLPAFIGAPGTGRSVTVNTQAGLIAFMPTGGTAGPLNAANGDVVINVAGDVPDPTPGGSGGDGAGVLAGQTLALKLSVALSNLGANPTGFGSYQLAASFCTCQGMGTPSAPYTISQCILDNAATVNNLLLLADQALRGVNLSSIDPCLTYSGINSALDALNQGFDECRTVCPCAP